jgi:drug/metabolite transporter (DMT)-like permease
MTLFALALILVAAVFHATWNLLAKRAGEGGAVFVWLFSTASALVYAPLVIGLLVTQRPHVGLVEIGFMAGSGVLHIGYFVLLQRGYAVGDLSVVYPLARGTGPLLASAVAMVFFGERPTTLAFTGIVLIAVGVFLLTGNPGITRGSGLGKGMVYGLATGAFIAAYTLWDKHAVSMILIPPLLMSWAMAVVEAVLLAPLAMRGWGKTLSIWHSHRLEVSGIAVLSPLSYILILTALVFTPVSYVAPAREISILIGAAMGARLLAEDNASQRLLASSAMVLGIVALTLG